MAGVIPVACSQPTPSKIVGQSNRLGSCSANAGRRADGVCGRDSQKKAWHVGRLELWAYRSAGAGTAPSSPPVGHPRSSRHTRTRMLSRERVACAAAAATCGGEWRDVAWRGAHRDDEEDTNLPFHHRDTVYPDAGLRGRLADYLAPLVCRQH